MSVGVLYKGVLVNCMHQGTAEPIAVADKVTLSGKAAVVKIDNYQIQNCQNPPDKGGPCVIAQWTSAASFVTSMNIPILLQDSQAVCTPTGMGVKITQEAQPFVKGK